MTFLVKPQQAASFSSPEPRGVMQDIRTACLAVLLCTCEAHSSKCPTSPGATPHSDTCKYHRRQPGHNLSCTTISFLSLSLSISSLSTWLFTLPHSLVTYAHTITTTTITFQRLKRTRFFHPNPRRLLSSMRRRKCVFTLRQITFFLLSSNPNFEPLHSEIISLLS